MAVIPGTNTMSKLNSGRTHKALSILVKNPGVGAKQFAVLYYTEPQYEYLFTAVSNQGNGACAGKKAWLCAGSFLGRLCKVGLVRRDVVAGRFYVTDKGKQELLRDSRP